MVRLRLDPAAPDRESLERAAEAIRAGAIVALPTDTLYALAVDPFREDAIERLFAAKGRPAERAVPLVAADLEQVQSTIGALSATARALASRFWPGPLTLLLDAPVRLAAGVTGGTGRVGVRVPAHAVARGVCRACGHPVTATSANLSGHPASADPNEVERTFGTSIALLLDAGPTPGGAPSTIVDVAGTAVRLVRAGAIGWDEVQACLAHA